MDSPIKDMIEMVRTFKDVNFEQMLLDAYNRGFQEGYEMVKEKIIEEIKRV